MERSRKSWSDTDLKKAVSDNYSIAGVLKSLKLKPSGGNYNTVKNRIEELKLDISHFTGKGWNKGLKFKPKPAIPLEDILVENNNYQSFKLAKRLIKEDIKELKCENCGLSSWLGQPIKLELHHKNGISNDNRLENLQLLCPNCHSFTDNYRGKNINKSAPQETGDVESP